MDRIAPRTPRPTMLAPTCALVLTLAACTDTDFRDATRAAAGCEEPTAAELAEQGTMMPGRICTECHYFTVAGTVFPAADAPCNGAGLPGVDVEILDPTGAVQLTMTTNSAGNFYSYQPLRWPMRVRLTAPGKTATMVSAMHDGACAECHQRPGQGGTVGAIFLE